MEIFTFATGPVETNVYIAFCPKTKNALIIDPAPGSADHIFNFITEKNLNPQAIWLTHSHWDHIADVARVKKQYGIDVWIHPEDKGNLEEPGSDGMILWLAIVAVQPDHFFEDGMELNAVESTWTVIHTPGHTPGSVCFFNKEEKILITGDTLFRGSIGNISFPTAQPERMWVSIDKLAALPDETKVYPGHGVETTIGAETWLPNTREIYQ
ncbi:MAG: MBL fold metallo-hydrolase [Waddliaceae bacterium]